VMQQQGALRKHAVASLRDPALSAADVRVSPC
jgi:hypothetical protein